MWLSHNRARRSNYGGERAEPLLPRRPLIPAPAAPESLKDRGPVRFQMRQRPSLRLHSAVRQYDKLASYVPAIKRAVSNADHRRHKRLNNRAENSHRPVRKRERAMQRFKSPEQAQRFLETFSAVCNHFRPRRHGLSAGCYRRTMRERNVPSSIAPRRRMAARERALAAIV